MSQNAIQIEDITPDRAREMLSKNVDNRNLREKTASHYAKQIKEGKWQTNGVPIIIGTDGRVLDGQHRLRAIVMANKSIQTFVVTGMDPKVFSTIDVGLRRSPADVLTIHSGGKVRWPTAIGAALRIINHFDEDGTYSKNDKEKCLTHGDLIRLYDENLEIQDNLDVISQYKNVLTVVPHSIATALYTVMKAIDSKDAENFWMAFDTGENLKKRSPILALRNRFNNYMVHNGGKKVHRRLAIAMIVKAWNTRRQKKSLEKLSINDADPIILRK